MNDPTLQSYWRRIDAVPLPPADEQFRLAGICTRTGDPAVETLREQVFEELAA
jgi:hypothetical protein